MAKILIVDDSDSLLEVLSFQIRRHGDEAVSFYSLENFVEKVQKHQPDVILMDILQQGIDGIDLCKGIKSTPATKHIPIILMSACSIMLSEYEKYNAEEIIEKPFDFPVVYEKINAVLSR